MKNMLKNIIDFWKQNHDLQQAAYRIIFTGAILAVLIMNAADTVSLMFCGTYFTLGLCLFASICYKPKASAARRWVTLVTDISATSFGVFLTSDIGGVFIGIYLWLIIGYGLRYGNQYLKVAHLLSILGFIVSSSLNPYWSKHQFLVYGLLITMTLVPVHIESLLRQLKVALQAAEAATKAKANFLSHISHEIRTPLNGIVNASDLMNQTHDEAERANYAAIMKNSSQLLKDLVDNVLDLSKIENAKMKITPVKFHLNALIDETLGIFALQAKQKNIHLSYSCNLPENSYLMGDHLRIKQVLINLIGNAIKFTSHGSITLRINSQNLTNASQMIKFEVVDSGIGIASDMLPHIFESFTQANDLIKYQFGGTGLGTAISKELVGLMDGNIGVNSQLGIGSNFWFEIPLSIAENRLAPNASNQITTFSNIVQLKPNIEQTGSIANRNKRILIADDNATNLFLLEKILQLEGYQVTSVSNGEQALDALEHTDFDMAILDKNMPEKDGLEVTKLLRALNLKLARMPVIILSADDQLKESTLISTHGIDALLSKPINKALLLEKISQLISHTPKEISCANNIADYQSIKIAKSFGHINLQTLSSLASLDSHGNFMQRLINDYVVSLEQGLGELNTHLKRLDYTHINSLGHAFAGSSANIGADALTEVFQALNDVTPYDEIEYTASLVNKAFSLFEATKAELLAFQFKNSAIQ